MTGRGFFARTPVDPSVTGAPGRRDHTPGTALALGPASLHMGATGVRVGEGWAATVAITGYPGEIGMGWLEPVLAWPGRLDVAIHIDPIPTAQAASRLRKQRARLESARRIGAQRGTLEDPLVEATAADAADLADLVARGESRLFSVGIYLTVHARTRTDLTQAVAEVRAAAASVLLDTQPVTWRQQEGWTSTLPLGHDGLRMRRVMDTDALAAAFPLGSPDLPGPLPGESEPTGGVLYGVSESGAVVWWDRWACANHNSVILAHSGAGKSYLTKLDVLRQLYDHVQVAVIDPEDEYVALARAVGGSIIQLGADGVRLNPFDLPTGQTHPDALTRRALFLHTLIAVMLGQDLPPGERAALDRAISATYTAAGITQDPRTWTRPAPLLRDLAATLTRHAHGHREAGPSTPGTAPDTTTGPSHAITAGDGRGPGGADSAAATLAARLSPWVEGSFKDLFDGPGTANPHAHLVVWSTRYLPDELRAVGMLLALDAVWRDIDTPTRPPAPDGSGWSARLAHQAALRGNAVPHAVPTPPGVPRRLVVVDEAWSLMRESEGARFLARMAKSARKRRAGLAVVTQDAADLLASDLGQIVVANAATQILMRQAPQAITEVATTFALTAGEARLLATAERGQALLLSGRERISFVSIASEAEHALATGWADQPDPHPGPPPGLGPPPAYRPDDDLSAEEQ